MSLRIERILYPTDFSKASLCALTHALFLAEQHGAELHLLHAQVLHEEEPVSGPLVEAKEILRRLFAIDESEVQRLIEPDRAVRLTLREALRRGYSAPEVILEYQNEVDADLIVMSTHGRRAASRFFLGSVTEAVLRHADCPVLTMRSGKSTGEVHSIDRILVPLDFSDPSREALLYARELALSLEASLQLLYVVQITAHPYFYVPTQVEIWEKRRKAAIDALEELARDVLGDSVSHRTFVSEGRPAGEIARLAEARSADLVVISGGLG